MRWQKFSLFRADIIIAGTALFLILATGTSISLVHAQETPSSTSTIQATPTVDATVTELNKEQLTQQLVQQQHTWENWFWSNGATLLSPIALAFAGIFTVMRYFNDRKDIREKKEAEAKLQAEERQSERDQKDIEQKRWLKNQESEREKNAEKRFQSAVKGLSSEREEARIGAAIILRTFLHPGYEQFYTQTFDLAVVHLRLPRTSLTSEASNASLPLTVLQQALIVVIKESFPLARDERKRNVSPFDPRSLDASRIHLDNAYLAHADLDDAWLREAFFRKANLGEAHLSKAELLNADFTNAHLGYAQLDGAKLRRACLDKANLINANLTGADLTDANLNNANLKGANPEDALSLEATNLRGATGLSKNQLNACKARGAIIDEDPTISTSQLTTTPP